MEQPKDANCLAGIAGPDEPLLMKSKLRVQKHGEVFTPQWLVDKMLSIPGIKEKAEDIFATFLEPSAGEGAFLLTIENLKMQFVSEHCHKNQWDLYALWALTSIYGIEFLADNLVVARQSMLDLFASFYEDTHGNSLSEQSDLYKSARTIIWANIVQGNTLTHQNQKNEEIILSRWSPVPGKPHLVKRTTFTYSSLFTETASQTLGPGSLFDLLEEPVKEADSAEYAVVDLLQVWREEKVSG